MAAITWIEAALLGSVATTIAVIAIAWIGFMMFTGRISIRNGATVVLGCFVLFGASMIVTGLQTAVVGGGAPAPAMGEFPQSTMMTAPAPQAIDNGDPHAGASVTN